MSQFRLFDLRQHKLSLLGAAFFAAFTAQSVLAADKSAPFPSGQAGPYLATRQADFARDYPTVLEYAPRALSTDADRVQTLEALLVSYVALDQFKSAIPISRRLLEITPKNQLAGLVILTDALHKENWEAARNLMTENLQISDLVDKMVLAWISLGEGHMSQALEIFNTLTDDPATRGFSLYHKALALSFVGDYEGAARIFGGESGPIHLNRKTIFAYAQALSQIDRQEDALTLVMQNSGAQPDKDVEELTARLQANEAIPFTAISTVNEAIAEIFHAVAESRSSDEDATIALIFSRLSEQIDPNEATTFVTSAELLERLSLFKDAVNAYENVPKGSLLYQQAALGKALVLRNSGQQETAISELQKLADEFPETLRFRTTLGDSLLQEDRYEEALRAYNQAISAFTQELPGQWATYFQRAITHVKLGDSAKAEADLQKALQLNPNEPTVLNYLGYSYVDKGRHLDKALAMIKRAVDARPDSGYIVDSLGWGLFRTGKYEAAVVQMERAVELMAADPILNDHLGDTYWAVKRYREAIFQWKRALSFITEDTDLDELKPDRIRRKLEIGLDAVLEEEGAPALHNIP